MQASSSVLVMTEQNSAQPSSSPPKRKMLETHEDSGRHRASPRHEEEERQRKVREENNNPWKEALVSPHGPAPGAGGFERPQRERLSSPRGTGGLALIKERDSALLESSVDGSQASPTNTYRWSGHLRRKPVSPTLVTTEISRASQLPTPPPQQLSPVSPPGKGKGTLPAEKRDESLPGPSGSGPSRMLSRHGKEPAEPEDFYHLTRRRYKEMLQAESIASTETDKLRVFLEFIDKECRFRTPIYPHADVDYRNKLAKISALLSAQDETQTPPSPDEDGDINMAGASGDRRSGGQGQWWGQNLDPFSFPSKSAYEARIADEESSRGRTSSRWWETSKDGGSCSISESVAFRSDGDNDSVYGTSYPRRSRRFNKTPRQSLKEIAELVNTPRSSATQLNGATNRDAASYLHSAAYPPDRKPSSRSRSRSQAPSASRPRPKRRPTVKTSLDIAPLLTLLPTWPKEYPAVNNSHPRLEVFRDLVRTLNDISKITTLQTRFDDSTEKTKDQFLTESQRRRISQAERIQGLYTRGDLNYDEMERLNLQFEHEESKIRYEAEEEDFNSFVKSVVEPAHRDLHERITAATAAYSDLVMLINARNPSKSINNNNDDGEEEQPELLEYLTALKWIFDVRESLYQHSHDILSSRNERYRNLTLTPLRDARDQTPLQQASAFFTKDAQDRAAEFKKLKIQRYEKFMDFIELQCSIGVEEARSRFWEIAPLIMECLEKIPQALENVVPIVPPEESIEHPEWVELPMRYLERKIAETEGAMRSLGLEEGEGLLCLLHGVKTALSRAKGEGQEQERRLTEDLKEKVGMIEEEWQEGLGGLLERIKGDVEREMERIDPAR
ncbi:hypothetical protein BZA77DRAFT_270445 [Pyronema omphalodes]|nr:hypothetical protein BZA77DRAFT_270445 [Pyronema omphalodes]